ncbi:MAG: hypothetical protein NC253_14430 [Ruminococcus sp.]|nr:hypothetical protein [Ruminococcus sp.]MCM1381332.1 hypothetical protein [Muribaculaceae bacterium]MCM1479866.1 hypothetical protein [Muribaculaceae bacterium]
MTAFETTIRNIQKVLDTINCGQYTAKTQIASAVGFSPALTNKIMKKIEPEINIVGNVYTANVSNAEETSFYKKYSKIIPIILADPSILFWQNKHISLTFDLSLNEVQTLRAYVYDIIKIREKLQRRNGDEKV